MRDLNYKRTEGMNSVTKVQKLQLGMAERMRDYAYDNDEKKGTIK